MRTSSPKAQFTPIIFGCINTIYKNLRRKPLHLTVYGLPFLIRDKSFLIQ
jgi:hypothetical protein